MRAFVTGTAGFIGSTLAARLVADGWTVVGADCFADYYDPDLKRRNIAPLADDARFRLETVDLGEIDVADYVGWADVVFHLAAQPGVRFSWENGFANYVRNNIEVTQRLLEAARRTTLERFVYSSSSSVYGNSPSYPTAETAPTTPFSPYGVTKLAGEMLCSAYAANFGVPTTSLRYFTVYGPRQRPDMAITRLIDAALDGTPFTLLGDGRQVRDFTFVDDVVSANIAALGPNGAGEIFNIAGGSAIDMTGLIRLVEQTTGNSITVVQQAGAAGDVSRTGASVDKARRILGWEAATGLEEGIARQVEWQRSRRTDMLRVA